MDIDGPVRPVDPAADARRVAGARRERTRSGATLVLTLLFPVLAMGAGGALGAWHADAPVAGAIGMLLAWLGARAVLYGAALLAVAFEAPSLLRRLLGRPGDAAKEPPMFRRTVGPVVVVYVLAFAALGILAGVAAGVIGPGEVVAVDVFAFGVAGAALGMLSLLADLG